MSDLILGLTLFGGAAFCMGYLLSWVRRPEPCEPQADYRAVAESSADRATFTEG